jgi:FtsH-binding integral membrane protein
MFNAGQAAWDAPVDARVGFIRRTYAHLAGAIGLFVAVSWALYVSGFSEAFVRWLGTGRFTWLLIIGAFAVLGWVGTSMAHKRSSGALQYAGLGLYALGEAVVFAPILFIAARMYPGVLAPAAGLTLLTFGGLSAFVLLTKRDFSFMGTFLKITGLVVFGVIICAMIFNLTLGIWFSAAMILFSAGTALYSTSKVLHTYRVDQHVPAALELFASIAMMFFYILRLLMQLQRR